jgi:hypothetical protein
MAHPGRGDPVSPPVRGVAALLGGGLIVGGILMWVSIPTPILAFHPHTVWSLFLTASGGFGAMHTGTILVRAAITGISPRRSGITPTTLHEVGGQPNKRQELTRR